MIRAFRDTWELGIHSYLTYLRDRLLLARELLAETGSCFVQISDENIHLVRCIMDEVFGAANAVSMITFQEDHGADRGTSVGRRRLSTVVCQGSKSGKIPSVTKRGEAGEEWKTQYVWQNCQTARSAKLNPGELTDHSAPARIGAYSSLITAPSAKAARALFEVPVLGPTFIHSEDWILEDVTEGFEELETANRSVFHWHHA